jgi:hypothetical protein
MLILILGTLGLNFACQGCHSHQSSGGSTSELTKVPPVAQGGPESTDTIVGRVKNARAGRQIVIYAHNRDWCAQPWPPYLGS